TEPKPVSSTGNWPDVTCSRAAQRDGGEVHLPTQGSAGRRVVAERRDCARQRRGPPPLRGAGVEREPQVREGAADPPRLLDRASGIMRPPHCASSCRCRRSRISCDNVDGLPDRCYGAGENSARTSEIGDWVNAKTPFVALSSRKDSALRVSRRPTHLRKS